MIFLLLTPKPHKSDAFVILRIHLLAFCASRFIFIKCKRITGYSRLDGISGDLKSNYTSQRGIKWVRLPRAVSNRVLHIPEHRNSTISLGNPLQYWIALMAKNVLYAWVEFSVIQFVPIASHPEKSPAWCRCSAPTAGKKGVSEETSLFCTTSWREA